MFWGLVLEPGKRYTTKVGKSFHISMASLDSSSVKQDGEVLNVMLEEGLVRKPFILCNLNKQKMLNSVLDLNFMTGDEVTFFVRGSGVVHLTGYLMPEGDEFSENVGEDEEDDEDWEECEEEEEEKESSKKITPGKLKSKINGIKLLPESVKRKIGTDSPKEQKKPKLEKEESEDSDDDEDEDSDDEVPDQGEMDAEEDSEGMGAEEEESEDESDEGELKVPVTTPQQKKDKKKPQGQQQQLTPNVNKQSPGKGQKTPNGLATNQQSSKKEKKKGETPSNTPKANKPVIQEATLQKTLEGGVFTKDLKIGNGPVCKPGKMATVYYVGKLKSNNKVFDSTQQGPGFKFRVGRGEVIKGWDVGLVGMKVGGKRIITCPPHMAYGQKGSPPTIPGNSALVFEVELKGVN